jgi:hypothetical protein
MDSAIDTLNRTGLWLAERLEPLPVDAVMLMFTGLAVCVWVENLRVWARQKRAQRLKREAVAKAD